MRDDEWWRGAVIYQIYPRSFQDSNGDGIGDLAGITARLDYLASLGIDALWLSPFFVSPMCDFGYDVADHCAVDPVFGTLDDFDRLVAEAHARNLRIVIDLVCGHTSDRHPWFAESRAGRENAKAAWYVWADAKPDGTPPNNWLSVFGGGAWRWEPRRCQYYLHHFLSSQPALNLRHPAVVEGLLDVAAFWLGHGVDGFRLDAVDFLLHDAQLRDNPPRPQDKASAKLFGWQYHQYDMMQPEVTDFLRRFRQFADRHAGAVLLGEVSSQDGAYSRIERYTARGEGLHMAYTLQPLRSGDFRAAIGKALDESTVAINQGWQCWAFSNHDVERAASRWNPDPAAGEAQHRDFVRLLLALLLSLGGSVCLYQGEELGLTEAALDIADLRDPFGIAFFPLARGRDGCRTPMPWDGNREHAGFTAAARPWLPLPPEHEASSIARQEADPTSPLQIWRRLIRWRARHGVLRYGRLRRVAAPVPLIAFERIDEQESLLAVFNPSGREMRWSLAGYAGAVTLEGHGLAGFIAGEAAVLPPYGALFLSTTSIAAG